MHTLTNASLVAIAAALAVAGCGGDAAPTPPPAAGPGGGGGTAAPAGGGAPASAAAFDAAKATATITVKARVEGTTAKPRPVSLNDDCAKLHTEKVFTETYVVGEGGALANVIAHVSKGAEGWKFTAPTTPVKMDQKGCVYVPHVVTLMVGQPLEVSHSDPEIMHNVHTKPGKGSKNAEENKPHLAGSPPLVFNFKHAETGLKIACDVHSWMEAYAGVFSHPFHGATGADGSVALPRLPAGTYEVSGWHEALGGVSASVTVADGESKTVELVFKAK